MMKKLAALMMFAALVFGVAQSHASAPRTLAGIKLGNHIDDHKELLVMDSALVLRHMEYLSSMRMKPVEGFKSGYVFYGNCAHPGKIVKLKLKYLRDDKKFFEALLDRFKKKFGRASEYKGDPFGGFIAWKWSFRDGPDRISLILQHNAIGDEGRTDGTSIKISITSAIEEERRCFRKKFPGRDEEADRAAREALREIRDFSPFIPD